MSVAFFAIIIFAIRALMGLSSWIDVLYGVLAEILLLWALRPNLKKLFTVLTVEMKSDMVINFVQIAAMQFRRNK